MEIKDRVSAYCNKKNIAISRFEKEAGLSNGYFNQVKKRPSLDKIESIKQAFPDFNTDWLLTGEGEMLRPSTVSQTSHGDYSPNINGNGNRVDDSSALMKALDEISELRKQNAEQFNRFMGVIENLTK